MKKFLKIFLVLLILLSFVGCSSDTYYESTNNKSGTLSNLESANSFVDDTSAGLKIIYSVDYTIYDCDENIKGTIKDKVIEFNGAILNSYETDCYSNVEYKVPTTKLDEFLDFVDAFGSIGSKEVSSSDITSTYNNVEARIETLNACKTEYLALLADATSTADIIAIRKELNDIESELTSLNKTKAAYDDEIEYSRVEITYYPTEEDNFFSEYFSNLLGIFRGLGIAILYMIPIGGAIGGVVHLVLFIIKMIKKNKEKKKNINIDNK